MRTRRFRSPSFKHFKPLIADDLEGLGVGGGEAVAAADPALADTDIAEQVRHASPRQLQRMVAEIARRAPGRTALRRAVERMAASEAAADPAGTRALIAASGGLLTSAQVAERLGQTRQNVNELLKRRRVLGVRFGTHWRFPAIQFRQHEILPGLAPLLRSLEGVEPWQALDLLVSPREAPERQPIEMLRRGDAAGALAAVSRAVARQRAAGPPVSAALDEDLAADLRREQEIDALLPIASPA